MTFSKKKFLATALAGTAAAGLWAVSGFAQNAAGPFNAAQVEAGRATFAGTCMVCHGDTMSGLGEAPGLAGRGFMVTFGAHSAKDLFDTIKAEMPFGAAGTLSDEQYTNLVAFILHANGARTGTTALTPTSAVRISSVASGTVAADITAGIKPVQTAQAAPAAAAPAAAAAAPARGARGAAPAGPPREEGASGGFTDNKTLGLIKEGTVQNYQDVTDEMLANPADGDWLMYRGNLAGWSYSKLGQITNANVNQLQLKWTLAMTQGGTNENTPLVHSGTMFLVSAGNTIQAIKADTGEVIWQNNIGPRPNNLEPAGDVPTRSLGVYHDKLIVPTMQGKIYGLDARTGKIAWQTWYSDPAIPEEGAHGSDGGVIVAHGKAIIGMTGCGRIPQTNHCYISAYDADTGKRAWKFNTVALTGQPGGDTWGKLADDQRAGGETWIAGTVDPTLNLTYWGTAQAKPWRRDLRGSGDGATLYANSTVALDVDTGKLKWYFSHAPGESFDLDEVFERILIDHGPQKTVMTTGKVGILWKLDRETGKYLDSRETVFQNVFTSLDAKTGSPGYRKDILNQKVDQWIPSCPGPEGGKDWPAASYHPPSDQIIIPLSQTCVLMLGSGTQMFYEMPGSEGNLGRLSSYETNSMKPMWSLQQRAPFLTGVVSTAGNVVFVGDFDRTFHAFDVKSGKQLWTTRLGTTVQGHIAPFAINGKEYIAVMTGLGGGSPEQKPTFMLSQEVTRPAFGTEIYVFALPDAMQQASNR